MNCQDITRIADTGNFTHLDEAQHRAAEAHARTCRHCAPVWATHARLAAQRVPPMPTELAVRVRTLAALPAHAGGRPAPRRLTVVGSLVALAAAAAMFTWMREEPVVTETMPAVLEAAPATAPSPMPPAPEPGPVVSAAKGIPALSPVQPAPVASELLPLVPKPVDNAAAQRNSLVEVALLRAAERHPELVEGPETDGYYAVGVSLREDGSVVAIDVRPTTREGVNVLAEIRRLLPSGGGSGVGTSRQKNYLLSNGRALRAPVSLWVNILRMDFDVSRSNARVLQALGDQYADQLQPASSSQMKRLTVFLSDEGAIVRASVDPLDTAQRRTIMGGDPNDALFLAQAIANRLELDVAQIGFMGVTTLESGSQILSIGSDGQPRMDDQRQMLPVYFAWQRRANESGPTFMQSGGGASGPPGHDQIAALAIVERMIPDAFTRKDAAAGTPTLVFTAKGELIKAGRVKFDGQGRAMDDILREQLVPGVWTSSFSTMRLRNTQGATVDVTVAWEVPEEQARAMTEYEKQRKEAGR